MFIQITDEPTNHLNCIQKIIHIHIRLNIYTKDALDELYVTLIHTDS